MREKMLHMVGLQDVTHGNQPCVTLSGTVHLITNLTGTEQEQVLKQAFSCSV
jgi:hypothetical protein